MCNFYFSVCEALPIVKNSENAYSISNKREGEFVNGTTVTYSCKDNYKQNAHDIICGVDGKWTGKVECYPGRQIILFQI